MAHLADALQRFVSSVTADQRSEGFFVRVESVEFDNFPDIEPILADFLRIAVAALRGMQLQRDHVLGRGRALALSDNGIRVQFSEGSIIDQHQVDAGPADFPFELGESVALGEAAVSVSVEQFLPAGLVGSEHEKVEVHGHALVAQADDRMAADNEEIQLSLGRFLGEVFDEFEDHSPSILTTDFTEGTNGLEREWQRLPADDVGL